MKYASTFFAVLLLAGWFSVPALYADDGGDYSAPPTVEDGSITLADGAGDRGGQPVEEQTGDVLMAEGGGGKRGGQPVDDAHDVRLA